LSKVQRERVLELQRALLARADVAPPQDWLPVDIGEWQIGVTSPETASFLATNEPQCLLLDYRLVFADEDSTFETRTALLDRVAKRLREAGLLRGWRNEQLEVRIPSFSGPLATIERAACRTLGIGTHAVHMNAFDQQGRLVVSRRADDKPIDPGMWDNLVGGMVAAGEDEVTALTRETREEAGLDLVRLSLTRGGLVQERRPVAEGYMVESIQIFDTVLPPDAAPRNEDGEVAAIETRTVDDVLDAIARGEFTLESALVTLDALVRRL
jgi:isopentenyldiphosphate isomerase